MRKGRSRKTILKKSKEKPQKKNEKDLAKIEKTKRANIHSDKLNKNENFKAENQSKQNLGTENNETNDLEIEKSDHKASHLVKKSGNNLNKKKTDEQRKTNNGENKQETNENSSNERINENNKTDRRKRPLKRKSYPFSTPIGHKNSKKSSISSKEDGEKNEKLDEVENEDKQQKNEIQIIDDDISAEEEGKSLNKKKTKISARNQAKKTKPAKINEDDDGSGKSSDAGSQEYEVDKLIDIYFKRNGKREFLVRWKGYSSKDDTWEPESHLNCPELIESFLKKCEQAKNTPAREMRTNRKVTDRYVVNQDARGRKLSSRLNQGPRKTYYDAE